MIGWVWGEANSCCPSSACGRSYSPALASLSTPACAEISSPRASVLLRRGKTTPIYRLIRESCRENGAGGPCCGDCCRCPVFPSRAPVSGGERQTRTDDRDRRGDWSGNRQIREGSADDGGRPAGGTRRSPVVPTPPPPHPPST